MTLNEIIENFTFLDDWDDRYRYLIELGRTLEPLPASAYTDANKVLGCASQVWLRTDVETTGGSEPHIRFRADSDAHIVRGLIAILLTLYSGKTPSEIAVTDAQPLFQELGLSAHLTPQRSNGVRAMVERIKHEAQRAAEAYIA